MPTLDVRIKKGLKLFIGFVIVTMLALIIFTASRETIEALGKINPFYIIIATVFWGIYLLLDAVRISLLTHGITGRWGSLKTGIDVILTGAFLAAITPFQTGGLPVQLYIFKRDGIPWGKGTLIILLRGIFFVIMMITLLPFLLPILAKESTVTPVRILYRYSGIIYFFIGVLIALILIKPEVIKRFIYRMTMRRGKRNKTSRWIYRIFKEIKEMKDGFWRFSIEKKWHSLASFFLTYITYIPYFFIAPLLLRGLGIEVSFMKAAFLQLVVVLFTFFSPTPGATGVSEGGFALLFSPIVARHMLGVFTILWRFFTFYLTAVIGGIDAIKVLKLGGMEFEQKKVQSEES